jgi:hypothetical protein
MNTEKHICLSISRAPLRLLSIRAPRQAVLRTSSRLAPSRFTNRPCDLPVEKTLDASNRRLPPKRSACTRTSRVPGSLAPLSRRGVPTESWAPRGTSGDLDVSRRPRSLRRIVFNLRVNSSLLPYGLLTRAWAFSSHGEVAIEPLTPLSRPFVHPPPRSSSRALRLHRSLAPVTESVRTGRKVRLAAETTVAAAP